MEGIQTLKGSWPWPKNQSWSWKYGVVLRNTVLSRSSS